MDGGRRGTAKEIANVVAFLASFITGAYIPVCGGNPMPAISAASVASVMKAYASDRR